MSEGFWMMQDDMVFIWIFLMMTIILVPFVSLGSRSSLVVVGEVSSVGIIAVPMLIHLTYYLSNIDLSLKDQHEYYNGHDYLLHITSIYVYLCHCHAATWSTMSHDLLALRSNQSHTTCGYDTRALHLFRAFFFCGAIPETGVSSIVLRIWATKNWWNLGSMAL